METTLRADPPLIKSLQNDLIELTLLLEKVKSSASKDYVGIAMGILFKYSAALLGIQQGANAQVSFILNSLAYHHLSTVSTNDVLVSAWIAMHLLEVAAAITCSDVTEDQVSHLWHREDLAEYCVDALIPSEGRINRLHSGVYRHGITQCLTYWPRITVEQICTLFDKLQPVLHEKEILRTIVWMIGHDGTFEEMALFDSMLQRSLGTSNDLNSSTLTSIDVKVYLYTLSLWSDSTLHPAAVSRTSSHQSRPNKLLESYMLS
ncbi:hypothetical protein KIN20_010878 [Parelaphostrongylus tenuis]|uniref:Uncharacterized protein n=1 Tax=Parelaphostrongylus tenuis TaxID=148309 RepID=A0AAD5MC23_PARTN|nr:hypothetical protein KIN20_010878 [Parelaphostrongylus tenuis]